MAERGQPSPAEWAIIGGGAVVLIGSFLDFGSETSAWGEGLFPVATLVVLYGVAMAVVVAISRFGNVQLPARVAGFTWPQVHLVLGCLAAFMMLCWLIADLGDKGIGLWLMLLGSLALAAGGVMLQRESTTGAIG